MTIREAKNIVAEMNGYKNWDDVLDMFRKSTASEKSFIYFVAEFVKYETEAMELYSKTLAYKKCEEQKIICANFKTISIMASNPTTGQPDTPIYVTPFTIPNACDVKEPK